MRTLSDVLKAWQSERDPTEKTVDEYRAKIRRFEEVHPDLTIDAITKADVAEFTDQLRHMPLHLSNEERTKPLPQLVEKYQDQPGQRVSQKTIKKHVDCIRTLIRFALDKGWIDANPLEGLKVALPTDRPRRLPFDTTQFAKVIEHAGRYDDERFWLPVLALYTGARLNELGQLHTTDVREADGAFAPVSAGRVPDSIFALTHSANWPPLMPFIGVQSEFPESTYRERPTEQDAS